MQFMDLKSEVLQSKHHRKVTWVQLDKSEILDWFADHFEMPPYAVFIDFSKAFDTVSREGLLQVLWKFGCQEKIINLTASLRPWWNASLCILRKCSIKNFAVSTLVSNMASTLFSLYLAAMPEAAFRSTVEGVYIQTRHNADLFNLSHFKSKTKTERTLVQEMLFVDDSAIVPHSAPSVSTQVWRCS